MNSGKLFWGIFIIAVGILWLLGNFGLLPVGFWQNIWRYWPLILVLWGISLLLGSKRSAGIWLSVILIVIFLAGICMLGIYYNLDGSVSKSTQISEDMNRNIKSGEIDFNIGAVSLNIESGTDKFVSGDAETITGINLSRSVDNEVQRLKIDQVPDNAMIWGRNAKNTLSIKLNQEVPTDIKINAGASKMDLDFSEVKLRSLEIDSGATSAEIRVGGKEDEVKINISCGASDFNIFVPKDSSLKVINKSGLSGSNISSLDLQKDDDVWKSKNYDQALKKIQINFSSGVSNLNISKY